MTTNRRPSISLALVAVTSLAVFAGAAIADGMRTPPVTDPMVAKECSACHVLYPAGLLPARSWNRLVGGLKDHFGDNAELDAAATEQIRAYLANNAADQNGRNSKVLRGLASSAEPIRITDLPWWKRKHEKKDRVAPATLARKGAKFKGDCAACHKEAAKGYFEED